MTDVRELKDQASKYFSKGKFDKAIGAYEELCKLEPGDYQLRVRLGDAYLKKGHRESAISAYKSAAENYARDGSLPRAIAVCKLILEIDKGHQETQQILAQLYSRKAAGAPPRPPDAGEPSLAPKEPAAPVPAVALSSKPASSAAPQVIVPPPPPGGLELDLDLGPRSVAGGVAAEEAARDPSVLALDSAGAVAWQAPEPTPTLAGIDLEMAPSALVAPAPDQLRVEPAAGAPAPVMRAATAPRTPLDTGGAKAAPAVAPLDFVFETAGAKAAPAPAPLDFVFDTAGAKPAPAPAPLELALDAAAATAAPAPAPLELALDTAAAKAAPAPAPLELALDTAAAKAAPAPAPLELALDTAAAKAAPAPAPLELALDIALDIAPADAAPTPVAHAPAASGSPALPVRHVAPAPTPSPHDAPTADRPAAMPAIVANAHSIELELEDDLPAPPPPAVRAPVPAAPLPLLAGPVELELDGPEQAAMLASGPAPRAQRPAPEMLLEAPAGKAAPEAPSRAVRQAALTAPAPLVLEAPAAPEGPPKEAHASRAPPAVGEDVLQFATPAPAGADSDTFSLGDVELGEPELATSGSAGAAGAVGVLAEAAPSSLETALLAGAAQGRKLSAAGLATANPAAGAPAGGWFAGPEAGGETPDAGSPVSDDAMVAPTKTLAELAIANVDEDAELEILVTAPERGDGSLDLPEIPLFSDLSQEAFVDLASRCELRRLTPGERIVEQGSVGTSFFVVSSGKVRVCKRGDDGQEVMLARLTEGAFFGEMALLSGAPRAASVIAEDEAECLEFSAALIADLIQRYPHVAQVLKKFCRQRLLANVMATSPLFRPFDKACRRDLVEKFKARDVDADEVIIEQGRPSDGLYVLMFGELEVRKRTEAVEGRLATLREGDLFGEISLLTKRDATATVVATRPSTLLRLPREAFDLTISAYPQVLELVSELTEERLKNQEVFARDAAQLDGDELMVL